MRRHGVEISWNAANVVAIAHGHVIPTRIASRRGATRERDARPFCRRHLASLTTPMLNEVLCGSKLRRRLVASRDARTNHPVSLESPC